MFLGRKESSTESLFFDLICPIIGVLLANIQCSSGVLQIKAVNERGDLGGVNVYPWAFYLANCFSFEIFATMIADPFVVTAQIGGLLVNLWGVYTLFNLLAEAERKDPSYTQARKVIEGYFGFLVVFWIIVAVTVVFVGDTKGYADLLQVVNAICTVTAVLIFVGPMMKLQHVFESGDTTSLYWPMLWSNVACSICWTIYAIVHNIPALYVGQGLGVVLSIASIAIKIKYQGTGKGLQLEDEKAKGRSESTAENDHL